jgi:hypothetical protein
MEAHLENAPVGLDARNDRVRVVGMQADDRLQDRFGLVVGHLAFRLFRIVADARNEDQ